MFEDVFNKIGKEWLLVAAGANGRCNAMTASWGGAGVLWNKRVCFVFVRPQRFTRGLMDEADSFSLSFFDGGEKELLSYMGSATGFKEDKISKSGLKARTVSGAPVFDRAKRTLICKKLYCQQMKGDCFTDGGVISEQFFKDGDYHCMYVGEIIEEL